MIREWREWTPIRGSGPVGNHAAGASGVVNVEREASEPPSDPPQEGGRGYGSVSWGLVDWGLRG